jgi:predicted thioesterase
VGDPGRTLLTFNVTDGDTSIALGSGDVPVLATPRLLAWLEAATCAAAEAAGATGVTGGTGSTDDGAGGGDRTSVGTRVSVEHLLATPVGGRVEVSAELVHGDGRLLRFTVAATDAAGRLVATGEVTRVVVDRSRFLARLPEA